MTLNDGVTYILVVVRRVQDVTLLVGVHGHRRNSLERGKNRRWNRELNGKLKGKVRRESRIEQTFEATAPFLSNRASVFHPLTTPPAACTYGGWDGCVRIAHVSVFLRYREPTLSVLSRVHLLFIFSTASYVPRPTLSHGDPFWGCVGSHRCTTEGENERILC